MIMESDKRTGALRKHYIGMVTMLDILAHIADDDHHDNEDRDLLDLDRKMAVPVSSIIGHNVEGLSLWTLNPNTSILDCMEIFSKGIHRALVPLDGQVEEAVGVELVESASSYRMLTQMDVLRFLIREKMREIEGILKRSVKEMEGMMNENVMAITDKTKVIEAIKCMKSSFLNAVPIVGSTQLNGDQQSHAQLFTGRGKKLVGTFSATDLRGCQLATLQSWLHQTALDFTDAVRKSPLFEGTGTAGVRELVTCGPESSLEEVIEKVVSKHVHRIWVTDEHGLLLGLVSLSDMIRAIRLSLLSQLQT